MPKIRKLGDIMATVSTALKMFDMMTKPLQQVTQALNLTITSMEQMNNSANRDIKLSNTLNAARSSIQKASAGLQSLSEEQDKTRNSQNRLNNSFNNGTTSAGRLTSKVKGLVGAYLGFQTIREGINITDSYINQNSRLNLINDGLQTQAELQDKIYQAAQDSRGIYGEMVSSISKLGLLAKDAFSSNDEIIAFTELMNKSFKISGASTEEAASGMYQLTQAMASGRLQGDEFTSIIENAPMLANAIADYAGVGMGELKELSSEGAITSDVIKNALFSAADDINAKFETMPMTFGTIWTNIKNQAVISFSEIMQKVNNFINSDNGIKIVNGITNAMSALATATSFVLDLVMGVATFFTDNWSWIEPIIWGIVGAIVAYNTVSLITNGILAFQSAQEKIAAASKMLHANATLSATAAQHGLNAALYACPLTWIIGLIIILITAFYAAIAAVNHFAGTSLSATGMICGAFATAGAFIGNELTGLLEVIFGIINGLINPFIEVANFIGNVFTSPVSSIIYLFQGMADNILGILEKIASAMDFVFGSDMASTVAGWRSGLKDMADTVVAEYAPNENYQKVMDNIDLSADDFGLKRIAYGDAYNSGYKFGENIGEKFNLNGLLNNNKINHESDFNNKLFALDPDSKEHLKNIDNKIDVSNENLELMRDLASQESIQNFTTLTPTVQVKTGDIKEKANVDELISKIEDYMENELANSAEGVYA